MDKYFLIEMIDAEPVIIAAGTYEMCVEKIFKIAMDDVAVNDSGNIIKRPSDYGYHYEVDHRDFYVRRFDMV